MATMSHACKNREMRKVEMQNMLKPAAKEAGRLTRPSKENKSRISDAKSENEPLMNQFMLEERKEFVILGDNEDSITNLEIGCRWIVLRSKEIDGSWSKEINLHLMKPV